MANCVVVVVVRCCLTYRHTKQTSLDNDLVVCGHGKRTGTLPEFPRFGRSVFQSRGRNHSERQRNDRWANRRCPVDPGHLTTSRLPGMNPQRLPSMGVIGLMGGDENDALARADFHCSPLHATKSHYFPSAQALLSLAHGEGTGDSAPVCCSPPSPDGTSTWSGAVLRLRRTPRASQNLLPGQSASLRSIAPRAHLSPNGALGMLVP
jgi:hypothetical protein